MLFFTCESTPNAIRYTVGTFHAGAYVMTQCQNFRLQEETRRIFDHIITGIDNVPKQRVPYTCDIIWLWMDILDRPVFCNKEKGAINDYAFVLRAARVFMHSNLSSSEIESCRIKMIERCIYERHKFLDCFNKRDDESIRAAVLECERRLYTIVTEYFKPRVF